MVAIVVSPNTVACGGYLIQIPIQIQKNEIENTKYKYKNNGNTYKKVEIVVSRSTVSSGGSAAAIKPGEAQFLCSRKQMLKEFENKSLRVSKRNICRKKTKAKEFKPKS